MKSHAARELALSGCFFCAQPSSAAALIMAVPVLAIYTTGQRYMVSGLIAGSVKG